MSFLLAFVLVVFHRVRAKKEFSFKKFHSYDGKYQHEKKENNQNRGNIAERIDNAKEYRLQTCKKNK